MLCFRLIARLDVRGEHLIKTKRLEGVRKIGDPYDYALRYVAAGIDEIIYMDAVASLYGRNALPDLVNRTRQAVNVPMTVGGGIRSVDDAARLLEAGADAVAVNSALFDRPELITEIAERFGSQAMTVQIDAKGRGDGKWECFRDGGREPTGRDAVAWAQEAERRGAGQVVVTSIDREGNLMGCETALNARISETLSTPVVVSGGVGSFKGVVDAARSGASGCAMAGFLHYSGPFAIFRAKRLAAMYRVEIRLVRPGMEIWDLWDNDIEVRDAA